ncbi:MAG: hypothetical protein QOG91_304 [Candidatus Parcubacteria bacterium]|jgi:hypothetical protein|nr:hypothetical protein [Candidatus Parcubacteria bacterium]
MPVEQTFSLIFSAFETTLVPEAIQAIIVISPIALAILLGRLFWGLWVDYVQSKQFLELQYTVLELKLPKETFKSPLAMESFLNSLHNTAGGSQYAQYWKGETRPWYSLELASVEGQVKFYIWTEDRRKGGVMSALFSQFPGIEVIERPDYTRSVYFDPKEIRIWACEFDFTSKVKSKKIPPGINPYPIKTYVDYGLDKDPKEEFKVDPLLPLIEFLGSVGPNQQVWFQIPIRAHKGDQRKPGHWFKRGDIWKEAAETEVNELLKRDPKTKVAGDINPETGFAKLPTISKGEQEIVAGIERKISKQAFDCGVRALYIAKKDVFNTPFGIGGIIGNMKQFNADNLNGFRPNGDKWHAKLGDPWLDYKDYRRNRFGRLALMAYKRRSYFYSPFKSKLLVLNTEELATIYHFPGSVSQTPTMERVPSKKAQAPMNLPV